MFKKLNFKFIKKEKKFKKNEVSLNSNFFWKIVLYLFFAIMLGSFIFSLFMYRKINTLTSKSDINVDSPNMIKMERINNALNYFKSREEKSVEIINSPSLIVDPSL